MDSSLPSSQGNISLELVVDQKEKKDDAALFDGADLSSEKQQQQQQQQQQQPPQQEERELPCGSSPKRWTTTRKVVLIVCTVVFTACLLAGGLLLGLFGVPYNNSQCALSESAVFGYPKSFSGDSLKTVSISNNGVLTIYPVGSGASITSFATVTAESKEVASSFPVGFSADDTSYTIRMPYVSGACPRQDVTMNLLDYPQYGPVSLRGATLVGDITFADPFSRLVFYSVELESSSGSILLPGLSVVDHTTLTTSSGDITVSGSVAPKLTAQTEAGSVSIGTVQVSTLLASVGTGNILVEAATLVDSPRCGATVRTSSGSVTIGSLTFPSTGSCSLSVETSAGDVDVKVGPGFAGVVYARSVGGTASFNGGPCHLNTCEVLTISGGGNPAPYHTINILAYTGNVNLVLQ